MSNFSTSQYIPMDTITYDIINKAAVKRINHQYSYKKDLALYLIKYHALNIHTGFICMTYDGVFKMAHFTSDEDETFNIDQTPTYLIITTSREKGALCFIDKRTGQDFTAHHKYIGYIIPELLLGLIRVYGQSQKALINERLKEYSTDFYPIDEQEEKEKKPIEELIEDVFNPDYAFLLGYALSPAQATRFKAWIESLN